NGAIVNVHATGSVVSLGGVNYAGGLVGYVGRGDIIASHFAGSVSAEGYAGGLTGSLANGGLQDGYARGEVDAQVSGGLIGVHYSNATLLRGYASAAVSGDTAGGLIGMTVPGSLEVSASFWDTEAAPGLEGIGSDTQNLSDIAGLAPAALHDQATFIDAGWDLTLIWTMHSTINVGYPSLRNERRNQPPMFTALSGALGTIEEDTAFSIDFAAIAVAGDQHDSGGLETTGGITGFAVT